MKKKMKLTTVAASVLLTFGLALTGCGNDEGKEPPKGTSSASDNGGTSTVEETGKNAAGVSQTINTYYTTLITESSTSLENAKEIEKTIRETTDDKTYEAFSTSGNPFAAFEDLSDDEAKELADKIQELNPVADLFDYSNMDDRDRIVLNLLNIASSVMLNGDTEKEVTISVPEESVIIEGNTASVPYSSMVFTVDKETQQMSDILGGSNIDLTYVNNEWKIDGQKTFESIYGNAQPSDAGEG